MTHIAQQQGVSDRPLKHHETAETIGTIGQGVWTDEIFWLVVLTMKNINSMGSLSHIL